MEQTQNYMGTIGWIKGNLMSNPELADKNYNNENFVPGNPDIPNSHTPDKTMMQFTLEGSGTKIENNIASWNNSSSSVKGALVVNNLPVLTDADNNFLFNSLEFQIKYGRVNSTDYSFKAFGFRTNSRFTNRTGYSVSSSSGGQQLQIYNKEGKNYLVDYKSFPLHSWYTLNFAYDNKAKKVKVIVQETLYNGTTSTVINVERNEDLMLGNQLVLGNYSNKSSGTIDLNECWFKLK